MTSHQHHSELEPVSLAQARQTFICKLPDSFALAEVGAMFVRMGCTVDVDEETNTLTVCRPAELIEAAA